MNLETKITIYKFTPQVFTLTPFPVFLSYFSKTNRLFGFIFSFLYICIKGSRQYLLIGEKQIV